MHAQPVHLSKIAACMCSWPGYSRRKPPRQLSYCVCLNALTLSLHHLSYADGDNFSTFSLEGIEV